MTVQRHYSDSYSALRAMTNCLLNSASKEGVWHDFDGSWDPIITTITAEFLVNAGLHVEDKWYVHQEEYKSISLSNSFKFLNSKINDNGSFGTDFWDTARLGKLIVSKELKNYFSNYDKLSSYLINIIKNDKILMGDSEWKGPGFYAAAVDFLDSVHMEALSSKTFKKLLSLQEHEGCWVGEKSKEGLPTVSPVWHTAQAIMTIKRKNPEKYSKQIEKALQWLCDKQENDGSWPSLRQYQIYFTSYAILALSGSKYDKEIRDAENFLKGKIDKQGKCSDLGGTLMCALSFWELTKERMTHNISFMDYTLSTNNAMITNTLEHQINELNEKLSSKEELIKGYKDADIVISKRQLFIIALVSLLITTIGTVAGIYGIKLALESTHPELKAVSQTLEQNNPSSIPGPINKEASKAEIKRK